MRQPQYIIVSLSLLDGSPTGTLRLPYAHIVSRETKNPPIGGFFVYRCSILTVSKYDILEYLAKSDSASFLACFNALLAVFRLLPIRQTILVLTFTIE